jgi:hypothetical protein
MSNRRKEITINLEGFPAYVCQEIDGRLVFQPVKLALSTTFLPAEEFAALLASVVATLRGEDSEDDEDEGGGPEVGARGWGLAAQAEG